MLRLCSERSRSYPGRPVSLAGLFFFSARYLVTAAVMRQESAEAIVGVDVAAAIRQLETSRGGTPEALPHRRAER